MDQYMEVVVGGGQRQCVHKHVYRYGGLMGCVIF